MDAVIVGAGMVGSSLALMLGQCGYRVALVEQFPRRDIPPDSDVRTMALSYASQHILSQLGIWGALQSRAEIIENVCVTVKGQYGSTRLEKPTDQSALGFVASVFDIENCLHQAIENNVNITTWRPAKVLAHQAAENHWDVTLETQEGIQQVQTQLLIASDGAHSVVAKNLNIQYHTTEYPQSAICANVMMQTATPNDAHERFLDEGALALLPWIAPYATCIWTCKDPKPLLSLNDAEFLHACQQAWGRRVGRITAVGKRIVYPLTMRYAPHQISWRFLLMGNAAHQLHPVAAQGLNLSLQDISALRTLLLHTKPTDLGASSLLNDYQQQRWPQQAKIIVATDALAKGMSTSHRFSGLRGLGITTFDMLSPLKNTLTQWGMGIAV